MSTHSSRVSDTAKLQEVIYIINLNQSNVLWPSTVRQPQCYNLRTQAGIAISYESLCPPCQLNIDSDAIIILAPSFHTADIASLQYARHRSIGPVVLLSPSIVHQCGAEFVVLEIDVKMVNCSVM